MFFDPLYLLFVAPAMLLALWASYRTKKAFKKYSKVRTMSGMTGAEAAALVTGGSRGIGFAEDAAFVGDQLGERGIPRS